MVMGVVPGLVTSVGNPLAIYRGLSGRDPEKSETIYLHRSGPLLENGLDRPNIRYGRCGFPGFLQHFRIYRRGG